MVFIDEHKESTDLPRFTKGIIIEEVILGRYSEGSSRKTSMKEFYLSYYEDLKKLENSFNPF